MHVAIYYTASPMRFHVTCTESNWCTFTWQPPPIRQESIVYYAIDCSTHNSDTRRDKWTYSTYSTYYRTVRFQPHQIYNCCVAAVNGAGRGNSICQIIITYETGILNVILTLYIIIADNYTACMHSPNSCPY